MSDDRILGGDEFVRAVLGDAERRTDVVIPHHERVNQFDEEIEKACEVAGVSTANLQTGSKSGVLPKPRRELARKGLEQYSLSLAETARQLGVTTNAVSYSIPKHTCIIIVLAVFQLSFPRRRESMRPLGILDYRLRGNDTEEAVMRNTGYCTNDLELELHVQAGLVSSALNEAMFAENLWVPNNVPEVRSTQKGKSHLFECRINNPGYRQQTDAAHHSNENQGMLTTIETHFFSVVLD